MAQFSKKVENGSGINIKPKDTPSTSQPKQDPGGERVPASRRSKRGLTSSIDPMEIDRKSEETTAAPVEKKKIDNKVLIGIAAVIVVIIIIAVSGNGGNNTNNNSNVGNQNSNQNQTQTQYQSQTQTPTATQEPELSDEQKLIQELRDQGYGIQNPKDTNNNLQSGVESDTFVKDLDGADIKEMYTVKAITYTTDFVIYTKHRAVTAEGIEIYWLDGTYNGKKCKMDVPYKIFKELADEGAVICKIEVVQTTDGNKIITWFDVVEDPLNKIKK